VQLNQIWRELGPSGGGPFWNQTTLINKLDKLERLEVLLMERRIIPSPRSEAKKKTNTFYRLNPSTPIYPYIYGMLKIYKEVPDKYSSDLVEKPLNHLCELAGKSVGRDPLIGRELVVAMELIGEVFSVGGDEVKRMIKDRMARKGMIKDRAKEPIEDLSADHGKAEKRPRRVSKRREKKESNGKILLTE
jgi:hypothetical protein